MRKQKTTLAHRQGSVFPKYLYSAGVGVLVAFVSIVDLPWRIGVVAVGIAFVGIVLQTCHWLCVLGSRWMSFVSTLIQDTYSRIRNNALNRYCASTR